MLSWTRNPLATAICGLIAWGFGSSAMALPWVVYFDAGSDSVCDVVNAANLELVVFADTGELVGITGPDVIFLDTFVDDDGFVFFRGDPAGFIEFAQDADGFRTLWLFTLFGDVADVDLFTGVLLSTGLLPFDFFDVPCDACPQWDLPVECLDFDGDGVEDIIDECLGTLFGELVDDFGCSCGQLDGDQDGIDDCIDQCPSTPFSFFAEADGCACEEVDDDFDGVDSCFDLCSGTPLNEFPDIDGCSCSQLDNDADGIDNCDDLCPNTPFHLLAEANGCACDEVDADLDGIIACFDLCPNTPGDEFADFDGCSCSQLDNDSDGIDNCNDSCPGTPPADFVDGDGCTIPAPTGGPIVFNFCGSTSAMMFAVMLLGLSGFRRRRFLLPRT